MLEFLANKKIYYFLVFLLCIISRLATSVYYIEDIDSLRFALSIYEYDLAKIQPHFPGYPVFCFIVKGIYFFTNSLSQSFSIIGGFSVFIIILYCSKIFSTTLNSSLGVFLSSIIFFNPLIWLMSNRYMPDLFGLAIACMIICLLIRYDNSESSAYTGFFLSGLLIGIRLSYFPIVFFVLANSIFQKKFSIKYLVLCFVLGIIIWLMPLMYITGIDDLILIAKDHTVGHFYDYGGSIVTDGNLFLRFTKIFESIWSDGLGGYWQGRSLNTIIISFQIISLIIIGLREMIKNIRFEKSLLIILISTFIYIVWIYFSQNVIYKSRHILPVLPFIFLILNFGYEYLLSKNRRFARVSFVIFLLFLSQITFKLTNQHMSETAISKVKNYIEKSTGNKTIISTPLVNFYLKSHKIEAEYIDATNEEKIDELKSSIKSSRMFMIGNFHEALDNIFIIDEDSTFYHNPYMNRAWASIETYNIQKK